MDESQEAGKGKEGRNERVDVDALLRKKSLYILRKKSFTALPWSLEGIIAGKESKAGENTVVVWKIIPGAPLDRQEAFFAFQ